MGDVYRVGTWGELKALRLVLHSSDPTCPAPPNLNPKKREQKQKFNSYMEEKIGGALENFLEPLSSP